MSEKNLEGLLNVSLENIKGLVDSNSIIGSPITTPDGTTIIPVSKVSFGFASGGSDFPSASPKEMFGGGSGGGVTIQPMAFLVIKGESVRMIHVLRTWFRTLSTRFPRLSAAGRRAPRNRLSSRKQSRKNPQRKSRRRQIPRKKHSDIIPSRPRIYLCGSDINCEKQSL